MSAGNQESQYYCSPFSVADITILGTLAILDTSSGINDEIRRQTNAKVVIENLESKQKSYRAGLSKTIGYSQYKQYEPYGKVYFVSKWFCADYRSDESEIGQVCLIGFDDMEKDSPFSENVCRLVTGEFAKDEMKSSSISIWRNGIRLKLEMNSTLFQEMRMEVRE